MIYKYTSTEEVIAQVLSRTRLTDATYADDMLEWLRDGMDLVRVRPMLVPDHKILEIKSNLACLPCGLVTIDGILYNGQRLREGSGVIDSRICKDSKFKTEPTTYFTHDFTSDAWSNNEQNYLLLRGDDIKQAPSCTTAYYIPTPNNIQTSFKTGCVQLFYRKMPTDERGFPLIPKEENIKFALYWWIMANLCLTGYKHNDPRMDYDYCEDKFNKYAKKGKGIIKYWSTDRKEMVRHLMTNLIPPQGYYESFGINLEQPKFVSK